VEPLIAVREAKTSVLEDFGFNFPNLPLSSLLCKFNVTSVASWLKAQARTGVAALVCCLDACFAELCFWHYLLPLVLADFECTSLEGLPLWIGFLATTFLGVEDVDRVAALCAALVIICLIVVWVCGKGGV